MILCVCLFFLSLSEHIFCEPYVQTSADFLRVLPVAVARSSSGGVCDVLYTSGSVDDIIIWAVLRSDVTAAVSLQCC